MCYNRPHGPDGHHKKHYRPFKMGIGKAFFGAFLVMMLWNALIPELFNGPILGYWQALAMILLARILVGWPMGNNHGCSYQGKGRWREEFAAKMKEKFEEKTQGMSDADKQRFKAGFTKGKWDVNIIEVEDEPKEDDTSDQDDKGDTPKA